MPLYRGSRRLILWRNAAVVAWTPASLGSALLAWYKADVGVYSDAGITPSVNSGAVQQWNDQSGHGYNAFMTTGGFQPTFLTSGAGAGKPALSFIGGSKALGTLGGSVAMGTGSVGSAFVAGQMNSAMGSGNRFIEYVGTTGPDFSSDGNFILQRNAGGGSFVESYRNGTIAQGGAFTLSTNVRLGTIYDGANVTEYLNNTAGTPVACTKAWTTPGRIGIAGTFDATTGYSGNGLDGIISEIVITNTALSSGDRASLEAYLAARW